MSMSVQPTKGDGRIVKIDTPYLLAVIEDGQVKRWQKRWPMGNPEPDPIKDRPCCDPPIE
jgi:hypothetical protein